MGFGPHWNKRKRKKMKAIDWLLIKNGVKDQVGGEKNGGEHYHNKCSRLETK